MPASPFEKLPPGTIFAQDYRIVGPIGQGGMGAVYEVEQVSTGKSRALKLMLPQLVDEPRSLERFLQEARVSAKIESDHVVEVVGSGVDTLSGVPWIAMELLRGETLDNAVESRGAFGPAAAHELFVQLRHALGAAHRVGLVHRDLKPENIFLATPRRDGVPFMLKVLDFGIAKVIKESKFASTTTSAVGSPLWMSPEQTRPDRISPATDVWALGLLAFYVLTGRSYWRAAHAESRSLEALFVEMLIEPLSPASERSTELGAPGALPPGFDAWFSQCVCREIDGRFADGGAALGALASLTASAASQGVSTEFAPTLAAAGAWAKATPPRSSQAAPPAASAPVSRAPNASHQPSYPPGDAYKLPASALATPIVPSFGAHQPAGSGPQPAPLLSAPPPGTPWVPRPNATLESTQKVRGGQRALVIAGSAVVLLAAGFLVGGLFSSDPSTNPRVAPPVNPPRANPSPPLAAVAHDEQPVAVDPPAAAPSPPPPAIEAPTANALGNTVHSHTPRDRAPAANAHPTPVAGSSPAAPAPAPTAASIAGVNVGVGAPAQPSTPAGTTAPAPSSAVTVTPAHYDTAAVQSATMAIVQRCWTNAQTRIRPHPTETVRIELTLNPTGRAYPVYVRGATDVPLGWCIGAELQRREFAPPEDPMVWRMRLTLTPD